MAKKKKENAKTTGKNEKKKKKRKDGFPKRRKARGKTDRFFPTAPQF